MTRLASAVIFLGSVIAFTSGFADVIAGGRNNGFGWLQVTGLVVGIALIGAGIAHAVHAVSESRRFPRAFEADGPTNDERSDPTGGLPPWP